MPATSFISQGPSQVETPAFFSSDYERLAAKGTIIAF